MACDCDNWIDCSDPRKEVGTYTEFGTFGHSYTNEVLSNDLLEFYQKTKRSFSVLTGWDRSVGISHFVTGCGDILTCDDTSKANPYAICSESCERETNVPYYWDAKRGIYIWKNVKEALTFDISSNKTAKFRMKWGTGNFHKVCIPRSVRATGQEQFIMVKDGVKEVLAEVAYDFNPFPCDDIKGGNWGLYGNVINTADAPDTLDVACILIFPTVPKLAMCQDNDCLFYGFYDYNAVEGGFIENSLSRDDGGKDYFYPYWCRSLSVDPLWRATADLRYEVIYSMGTMNLGGAVPWSPPDPETFPWPCGEFALRSKKDFIASFILQFGERANKKGIVYNESNIGNLYTTFKNLLGVSGDANITLYPVVPI